MRCEMQAERWEGLGRWRRKRYVEESARLKAVATRARAERTLKRGELRGGRRKMAGDGGAGEASIFLHTGRLPRYISHPSKIATTGILRQLPGMQLLVR